MPLNGGLAERYSKANGAPVSTVDLTWSYALALTAFQVGWDARGLTMLSACSTSGSSAGGTVAVIFTVNAMTIFDGESCFDSPCAFCFAEFML